MSSSSTDRPQRRFAAAVLPAAALVVGLALGSGDAATADQPRVVVGVLPSEDAAVTAELVRGMRLALGRETTGARVSLVIGKRGERWTTVASEAVRLATRGRALVLVAPPDRDRAHLLAQVGTRSRVPVVSTSPSPSVTAAGSKWVVAVVPRATTPGRGERATRRRRGAPAAPHFAAGTAGEALEFVKAFRRRHDRSPTAWEAVGHDTAVVITEGVRRGGPTRSALRDALRAGGVIRGATGSFVIDAAGNRRAARTAQDARR